MRKFCSTWGRGIFAALFPALLLLPALHLHPAATHEYGTHTAHRHAAVAHIDFLSPPARDHSEHHTDHRDHAVPDETSSSVQIGFSTLPSRHLTLLLSAPESVSEAVLVPTPVLSSQFAVHTWLLARDYALPVQIILLSPSGPRSPPRFV